MAKLTAKSLLDNFWIVEERGNKIGTLKRVEEHYEFYDKRSNDTTVLDNINDFKIVENNKKSTVNDTVYGYPANTEQAHDIGLQDTVPMFKKTATSNVYFAAGYYGLRFPKIGWRHAFCPRLKTLDTYEWIGPFKNESDMRIAIKRQG